MQRVAAIAWLTWKAAFRFRLFIVVAVLLLGAVIALPLLIKDDGTARGFTQILLTYTLTTISALLGLSTLWLACGTLARDIEECQMQVVAVKPIARWQIWLGKWLGLMSLNAALLALSGASVPMSHRGKVSMSQQVKEQKQILIPSNLMNATDEEIYQDMLFQILNPDLRIPPQYCLHVYRTVTPQVAMRGTALKVVDCKNCGKRI